MPATPFDSAIWRSLFHDKTVATLFTDTAVLRAELLVMGTLALTQAKAGVMPEICAKAIQRAAMEVQIDPAALGPVTAETRDPIAALVVQFKDEMKAPQYAKWVHFKGDSAATKATALSLRLRQVINHFEEKLAGQPQGDALSKIKEQTLLAFHPDPNLRGSIAAGLGLNDAGDVTPAAALSPFAEWIAQTASTTKADTEVTQSLQASVPHMAKLLDKNAAQTTVAMILPQLCLGLAVLLR